MSHRLEASHGQDQHQVIIDILILVLVKRNSNR